MPIADCTGTNYPSHSQGCPYTVEIDTAPGATRCILVNTNDVEDGGEAAMQVAVDRVDLWAAVISTLTAGRRSNCAMREALRSQTPSLLLEMNALARLMQTKETETVVRAQGPYYQ